MKAASRCAAPALVLAALVLLPFLGKAFTIDDTLFLKQAEHLLTDPLHPTAFEMVWSELAAPLRMSSIMPSGPVMAYLLVPCVRLGGAEWLAHLEQLVFFCLAILATTGIALRLGLPKEAALAAALLLAATPAALAMAATAMPDVPAMALGALGIERLLASRESGRWHAGIAAAAFLALAALARSHLLLLLGVAILLLPGDTIGWRRWREVPRPAWIPIVAAPLVVLAVVLVTRDPEGRSTVFAGSALGFNSPANLARNATAFAVHWTLVLPLALPWAASRWRAIVRQPFPYVTTLAAGFVLLGEGVAHRVFFLAPAAGLGAGVLWDVISDGWRRRDRVQTALGAWLLIALPVTIYLHMPSKYLLASAPAAAILVARQLAQAPRRLSMALLGATIAAGIVLGVLIVRADAAFAALGRRAAAELIAPNVAAGSNVWFAGHWGFQWYAEKAGARCLTTTTPPRRGDLAVSSRNGLGQAIKFFPRRELLAALEESRPGGRIMSRKLGCGFFSNYWGYLPWAWGDDLLDRYDLWRLE